MADKNCVFAEDSVASFWHLCSIACHTGQPMTAIHNNAMQADAVRPDTRRVFTLMERV